MSLSRRALLGAALATASALGNRQVFGNDSKKGGARCVSLDITATHICRSAGVALVGAASASSFRSRKADLTLSDEIIDVGLPPEPNLERIESLAPDLIVSAWPAAPDSPLRSLARFVSLDVLNESTDRYAEVCRSITQLGEIAGTSEAASKGIGDADTVIGQLAGQTLLPKLPLYLVNLNQDGVNLLAYGRHSLMDAVLKRLGIENAWSTADEIWGWEKTGPEALAQRPDATIVHIEQYWQGAGLAMHRLAQGAVWQALPQVQSNRVLYLPPIDIFGGLPTAMRFASLVTEALQRAGR